MKSVVCFLCIFSLEILAQAQVPDSLKKYDCKVLLNESYGGFERNTFDLILPLNETPHKLVIYIHGGGFYHGDKSELYAVNNDILFLIENNIAVATINYRYFVSNDSLGVKVCFEDIQRAIQYFRFNANKYNIDKSQIGAYGGSAGAGSSLYFGFHDEMAIPGDSTLLGESTRLKCIGAFETQSTYDLFAWKKVIPYFRLVILLKRKTLYNGAANFYGYTDYKSLKPMKKKVRESLDMLAMIDPQDPPVYLMNLMPENFPKDNNIIQHHKKHAVKVSKVLNKNGVENYLFTHKQVPPGSNVDFTIGEFFVKYLK